MVERRKAGGAHENKSLVCSLQLVSFTVDGNLPQPMESVNSTLHMSFLSSSVHALIDAHHTAWLKCWCTLRIIRIVIHVCDVIVCSLLFPHFVLFRVFLLSLLLLPELGLVPFPQ